MGELKKVTIEGEVFTVADEKEALKGTGGVILPRWGNPKELSVVGKPLARRRGSEIVTGRAQYASDVQINGMLYGKILRSPLPRARINDIDISRAEKLPGVKAVLTDKNTTKIRWIPRRGSAERFIFKEELHHVGDEVAAVAAEDEQIAQDALDLIQVSYQPAPWVIDPEKALEPGAPTVRPEGNIAEGKPDIYERGNIEKGFAESDLIHEETYRTSVQHHTCLEVHGCTVQWNGDRLTVWDSTQGVHLVKDGLAKALKMPINKIRVISEHTGGGHGSKNGAKRYHIIAALLAKKTGRAVRLFLDREEEFISSQHRPPFIQTMKAGVRRDGTLMAMYMKGIVQVGPYQESSAWHRLLGRPFRELYRCSNLKTENYSVHTNTTLPTAFRAPGNVENLYALEQFMDEIAEKLKMDPIDFRKKNFTKINQMQKMPYSSKGLDQCYQLGAETFGWIAKRAASAKGNRAKKRGVGMSSVYWTGGGRVPSQAIVILQPDGAAELVAGIATIGTGSKTVLVQIAAEELGIAPEKIRIKYGDSEGTPYFDTSSGSRTVPQVGPAVRAAAADAKRQLLDRVASWLKVQPEDLEMKGDDISIKKDSGKNISYNEAVKKIGNDFIIGTGRRNSNLEGYALNTFGAHFAEVEVDTETGEVRLIQAVCAHDSGRWINPLTSESQIQGGFLQGAGMALTEERILDSGTGIQLNADFHQYRTPTSFDLPETITPVLVEVLDPNTNIDAKGLGEPPNVGPGGAIANAIYHATGVRIREYPITPNRILAALKERKI